MNFRVEAGVTESPKAAAHHEIPPIRGRRVISVLSRIPMAPQLGRYRSHLCSVAAPQELPNKLESRLHVRMTEVGFCEHARLCIINNQLFTEHFENIG